MSEQLVTLGELVNFVLANRRGKAFAGYPEELIASSILDAANERTLYYSKSDDGAVNGIVVATKVEESKLMFIHDILTTESGVLGRFVAKFRKEFPSYRLRAWRWRSTGKQKQTLVDYRTDELCDRLMKGVI